MESPAMRQALLNSYISAFSGNPDATPDTVQGRVNREVANVACAAFGDRYEFQNLVRKAIGNLTDLPEATRAKLTVKAVTMACGRIFYSVFENEPDSGDIDLALLEYARYVKIAAFVSELSGRPVASLDSLHGDESAIAAEVALYADGCEEVFISDVALRFPTEVAINILQIANKHHIYSPR